MKLNISKQTEEKDFDRIAKDLFNKAVLCIQDNVYYLTEIEFYYNHKEHPDPFVHNHRQQKQKGKWYFHASGMDICIGNDKNAFGGILIRGLKRKTGEGTWEYTDGPINVLQEVLNNIGAVTLQKDINFGFKMDKSRTNTIYKHKRIGLNPDKKKKGGEYAEKHYRYLIDATIVAHKYKAKEAVRKANDIL